MGMGYAASSAIVIEREEVERLLPSEYLDLTDYLDAIDYSFEELALATSMDDELELEDEEASEVSRLLQALLVRFKEQFGIEIDLCHHDNENEGSRYDEVEGAFFVLPFREIYSLTPTARAMRNSGVKFEPKNWTTFC